MNQEWILLTRETRRRYATATWIPLRAITKKEKGDPRKIGYISDFFGCGSVAFPPEHRNIANDLSWMDIGLLSQIKPYAYENGAYSPIEQYECSDYQPIGVHLVFVHQQPVLDKVLWILNPDLVIALRLIKEGNAWVRPEENFIVVARETIDEDGNHTLIEIKREFLLDYLAARNLSLKLSTYRERVENVGLVADSPYAHLSTHEEQRDEGRFEFQIRDLATIFGGNWMTVRTWRNDVDEEEDAPIIGLENEENIGFETSEGHYAGYEGVRVEGRFWRDEWIDHQGRSIRVRGDSDPSLPEFITDTDGRRISSELLNDEDIGRWIWFNSNIINELLSYRGFKLEWYSEETGGIHSTSGHITHFGINKSDLISVYAYDIARLDSWEQRVWAAYNVAPEGKVAQELYSAQIKTEPASTYAPEYLFFKSLRKFEQAFQDKYGISIFNREINDREVSQQICRFRSVDQKSLFSLAKEIIRVFSDRLNVATLRALSNNPKKRELGTNKLLEDILAQKIGKERAHEIFDIIVGTYELRTADAHPTSSSMAESFALAKINTKVSFLRQGKQLIYNFGYRIWEISNLL